MKEFLINTLYTSHTISVLEVVIKLLISMIIGIIVYLAYYCTSSKISYSSSFNISLVAMTVITTAIMAVITNNIALSLGMVGALSIIRFRTAIKDPRDAMFIFWCIMVGICCGVEAYAIATAASLLLFLFFLLANAVRDEKRYILIIRCRSDAAGEVMALTYRHFKDSRLSVQNTTPESVELIYELKKYEKSHSDEFLGELYAREGIDYANFVLQEDKSGM